MELDIDYCNENKVPKYLNTEIVSKVPPVLLNAGFNKSLLSHKKKIMIKKKMENLFRNLAFVLGAYIFLENKDFSK